MNADYHRDSDCATFLPAIDVAQRTRLGTLCDSARLTAYTCPRNMRIAAIGLPPRVGNDMWLYTGQSQLGGWRPAIESSILFSFETVFTGRVKAGPQIGTWQRQIGRASCRGRVSLSV